MSGGEGDIRRVLIEGGAVDAMVALSGQLFYGTQIPACLWILAKDKSNGIAKDAKLRERLHNALYKRTPASHTSPKQIHEKRHEHKPDVY